MRQFFIKQFTIVQPLLEDSNSQDGQKSYKEFIYPTQSSFNLKSILSQRNLEYYYGIQLEMNYRILVGILEKWFKDLEDGIYYSGLREEDIWIRIKINEGQEINLQGIFNFDIEFSILPTDDYENVITQNEFKKILQQISNKSKEVYLQIDPENQEIIELLYNNLHKQIDLINFHEQISYYSYELFKFFVDNSQKNPLIWTLENNEWEVYVKNDILKNDSITDLLSKTLEENQNIIQQIQDPEIQRLTIEFVALQQLNCQPYLNRKLDDLLLYQAFHNNTLIEKFKGDFLKQLIEIKFFDQNTLHQDCKEFVKSRIQIQTRTSNFIDRLEIECIIACLNNPNLQIHQLFEQRKEEIYKQNIRNFINSFNNRIEENQIKSFQVQYQKSYNYWIQRFEENVTKFKSSDEALAQIQKEIAYLFKKNIEYLEANYIIGFDFNDLFFVSLEEFQKMLQKLQLDFETDPKKFNQQQYVQQHLQLIQYQQQSQNQQEQIQNPQEQLLNQQEQIYNQYDQIQNQQEQSQNQQEQIQNQQESIKNQQEQIQNSQELIQNQQEQIQNQQEQSQNQQEYEFTKNSIPQSTPPIIITPLSSVHTNDSQISSRESPDNIINQSNNSQNLGNPLDNSIYQEQSQFNILPPQNNNQPPQSQFNLTPSTNLGPPQKQQIQQDIFVGNPLDETIIPESQNLSRIVMSVSQDDDNVYESEVIKKPIVNNVLEIIQQTITSDDQLKQKVIEFTTKQQITQYQAQTFIPNIQQIMKFPAIYITQILKETQNYHRIQQNQINYDYHNHEWNKIIQDEEFLKALLQQKEQAFQYATQKFIGYKKFIDELFKQQARQSVKQE